MTKKLPKPFMSKTRFKCPGCKTELPDIGVSRISIMRDSNTFHAVDCVQQCPCGLTHICRKDYVDNVIQRYLTFPIL